MKTLEIAELLGISTRRVQQLLKDGTLSGEMKPNEVVSAYGRLKQTELSRKAKPRGGAALERLRTAQAEKAEVELAKLKGDLVSRSEAEAEFAADVAKFHACYRDLPAVIVNSVPELQPFRQEIEDTMLDAFNDMVRKYAPRNAEPAVD